MFVPILSTFCAKVCGFCELATSSSIIYYGGIIIGLMILHSEQPEFKNYAFER